MNTDNTFQNDMFATVLMNPQAKFEDFVAHGYNSDNTGLLAPEEYKKLDKVQETFTKDGVFDEETFNKAYLTAAYNYNELAEGDLFKKLEEYVEYSPVSMYAPLDKNISDWTPSVEKIRNPFENTYGINSLFGVTETPKSNRELAQTNSHYFDWNKQEWIEQSPNDFGISSIWKEPMVYAVWTEDGYHKDLETGKIVAHQKGEWKTDKDGKFYLETIGDREAYGMERVSSWDTLTSEGSFWNSMNIFESDEKEKSIAGTTFKLLASILPYCIPGVNGVYGTLHMAYGLASIMPTFYKSLEGVILGGDNKDFKDNTLLWQWATKAENWFGKYESSLSDEGKESFFTYEQIAGTVGDIFSQIYEQRAAAKFAGEILKTESELKKQQNIFRNLKPEEAEDIFTAATNRSKKIQDLFKRQSKLARQLSTGYMALTQSSEVYQQGLEAGYDRRAAGLTALMATSFQYYLMSRDNSLGDWFLDKTTGYVKNSINQEVLQAVKPLVPEMQEFILAYDNAVSNVAKIEAKKGLAKVVNKGKTIFNKIKNVYKNGANDFVGAASIEAVEEMTEEAAIDLAKGITDTLSWLGVWRKNGDYFKEGFFTEETFNRYLTSAIGGFVGGALFKVHDKYLAPMINGEVPQEIKRDINQLIADGHIDEVLKCIDDLCSTIENKTAAASVDINYKGINLSINPSTTGITQAERIKQVLTGYAKWVDGVLNQEGLLASDSDVLNKALINEQIISIFKDSGLSKFVLEDYKRNVQAAVDLYGQIQSVKEGEEVPKELKEKFKNQKKKVEDILTGNRNEYYMSVASMTLNKQVREMFDDMDFSRFVENHFNKKVNELSPNADDEFSLKKAEDAYQDYLTNTDKFKYIEARVNAYSQLQEQLSTSIFNYINSGYISSRIKTIKDILAIDQYFNMKNQLINNIGFENLKKLLKMGIDSNPENKQEYENLYNEISKGFEEGDLNLEEKITNLYNKVAPYNKIQALALYQNLIDKLRANYKDLIEFHNSNLNLKQSGVSLNNLFNINWAEFFESGLPDSKSYKEYLLKFLNTLPDLTQEQKEKYSEIASTYLKDTLKLDSQLTYYNSGIIEGFLNSFEEALNNFDFNLQITNLKNQLLTVTDPEEIEKINNVIDYNTSLEYIKQSNILNSITARDFNVLKEQTYKHLLTQEKVDNEILKLVDPIIKSDKDYLNTLLNNRFRTSSGKSGIINIDELLEYIKINKYSLVEGIQNFIQSKILEEIDGLINQFKELEKDPNFKIEDLQKFDFSNTSDNFYEDGIDQLELLKNSILTKSLELYNKNFWELSSTQALKVIQDIYNHYNEQSPDIEIKNILPRLPFHYTNNSLLFSLYEGYKATKESEFISLIPKSLELLFKEKVDNTLYDILRQTSFVINGQSNTIFDLLNKYQKELDTISLENWVLSKTDLNSIKEALKVIKVTKGVIIGMIDKSDTEDPFSFNSAIINYLNKHEKGNNIEKYKIISIDQAEVLLQDLEMLEQRLDFTMTLSNLQSNSQNSENIQITKAFEHIASSFLEDLINKYKPDWKNFIKTEDLNSDSKKLIYLEQLLYNEIGEDVTKFETLLNKLNINWENVAQKKSFGLHKHTTEFSDYDKVIYLTSILSLNPYEFYKEHLEFINQDTEKEQVPLYGQIRAAQIGKSFLNNKELFRKLCEKVSQNTNTIIDCSNLFIMSAIGGAGKTSAVGKLIALNSLTEDSKVFFGGPNQEVAKKLKTNITDIALKNDTLGTYIDFLSIYLTKNTIDNIQKDLINYKEYEDGKIQNPSFKYLIEFNNYYILDVSKLTFKKNITNHFEQVFFDEATNIPMPILQIFNEIHKKYKVDFNLFGDTTQMGERQTIPDVFSINPIRLTFSMRDSNSLKKQNNDLISQDIHIIQTTKNNVVSSFIKDVKQNKKYLKYYQSENNLIGEKIVKDVNSSINIFKKIKEENPDASIMVVIDDTITDNLKKALESINFEEGKDYKITTVKNLDSNYVQGQEADYVIVDDIKYGEGTDINIKMFEEYQKFYTMISRSLQGTLIINSSGSIESDFNVISVETNSFENYQIYTKETKEQAIEDFKEKQTELLKFLESVIQLNTEPEPEPEPKPVIKPEPIPIGELDEFEIDEIVENEDKDGSKDQDEIDIDLKELDKIKEIVEVDKTLEISDSNLEIFIHPFYNRIGCIQTGEAEFAANNTNLDINIFEPGNNRKYTETQLRDFLLFKNLVSLNSKKTIKKYLNLYNITGSLKSDNIKIGDIKVRLSKYNSKFDSPINTFSKIDNNRTATTTPLEDEDLFATLVREIKLDDKIYYITIAPFSKLSTVQDSDSIDISAKVEYEKLMQYFSDTLGDKSSEIYDLPESINLNENEDGVLSIFNQISGIRINLAEGNESLTLDQLKDYGIQYDEGIINVFGKNDLSEYLQYDQAYQEASHEQKKEIEEKLTTEKMVEGTSVKYFNFRGLPYITASLNPELRQIIVLLPKSRTFNELLQEITEINKIQSQNKSAKEIKSTSNMKNNLLSGYDTLKILFHMNNSLKTSKDNSNYVLDYLIYQFEESLKNLKEKTLTESQKTTKSQWESLLSILKSNNIKEALNKNTFDEFFKHLNSDYKNIIFRDVKRFLTFRLLSLINYSENQLHEYFSQSLNLNDAFKKWETILEKEFDNKFYYSKTVYKQHGQNFVSSESVKDRFVIRTYIQTPRYSMNMKPFFKLQESKKSNNSLNTVEEFTQDTNKIQEILDIWESKDSSLSDEISELSDNDLNILNNLISQGKIEEDTVDEKWFEDNYTQLPISIVNLLDKVLDNCI